MALIHLRLQRVGERNNHRWWVIAQAKSKHWKGSNHYERIGYWYPKKAESYDRSIVFNFHKVKYYLSHGALPTKGVYKLLQKTGIVPPLPIPYGSSQTYIKEEKPLHIREFKKVRWGLYGLDSVVQTKKRKNMANAYPNTRYNNFDYFSLRNTIVQNQLDNYISQRLSELELLANNQENTSKLKETGELYTSEIESTKNKLHSKKKPSHTDSDTGDINSDEPEFIQRKRNFEIVSKKLKNYLEYEYKYLRGNDLSYQTYVRKLEKLARKNGLDENAFNEFNKLVTSERERNEVIIKRLSHRFHLDYKNSKEFKKQFFDKLNNGIEDEDVYKKFVNEDLDEIQKQINTVVNEYVNRIGEDYTKILYKNERKRLKNNVDNANELVEDYKILRLAKLMKKLKEAYLFDITNEIENINEDANKDINKNESVSEQVNNILNQSKSIRQSYLKSVDNLLTEEDFIRNINIIKTSQLKNKDKNQKIIDDKLNKFYFHALNDRILNSNTFIKFKDKLLLNNNDIKLDDIYCLNDELIDSVTFEIERLLKKNYELNDLYNDDSDNIKTTVKRSKEIDAKLSNLKDKYGEINLLYDDIYSQDTNLKDDLRKLKNDYKYELVDNVLLEKKFKSSYRKFIEEYNKDNDALQTNIININGININKKTKTIRNRLLGDDPDVRKKYTEIYNKIVQDLIEESKGLKEPYNPKKAFEVDDKEDNEDKSYEMYYYYIRRDVEKEKLGDVLSFYDYDGLYYDPGLFALDKTPVINKKVAIHKNKARNTPEELEIFEANEMRNVFNNSIEYSFKKSFTISNLRLNHISYRFTELFGNNCDLIYPEGFRHLETFEMYIKEFPNASPRDYEDESKCII